MYVAAKTIALTAAVIVLLYAGALNMTDGDQLGASFLFWASGFLARELVITLIPKDDPKDATWDDHP